MKKAFVCVFLIVCLLLTGCAGKTAPPLTPEAPAESGTREFTDSTGRVVSLPSEVTKIAVSGPLSQVYIIPIAADMLVGVSNAFSSDAELYLPDRKSVV